MAPLATRSSLFLLLVLRFTATCTTAAATIRGERSEETIKQENNESEEDLPTRHRQSVRRILQQSTDDLSPLAQSVFGHLVELSMDPVTGHPNPRVTCTEGHAHAVDYLVAQFQRIGALPMGDFVMDEDNSPKRAYTQTLPGSVDPVWCPGGIRNVLAAIPGTGLPDEFIVYNAHSNGPNNANYQTDQTRGNQDTTNAYDDGLATALAVAMAEEFTRQPPIRSVLFVLDDGEEGWFHVGTRQPGDDWVGQCNRFKDTEWYRTVFRASGGWKDPDVCPSQLIGAGYFVRAPPVPDWQQIKMMYVIDPLGSSYGQQTNYLAALGGEMTSYGNFVVDVATVESSETTEDNNGKEEEEETKQDDKNKDKEKNKEKSSATTSARDGDTNLNFGLTANDFLDTVWPSNSNTLLVKGARAGVTGFLSNFDAFQGGRYANYCKDNCHPAGGIPAVWFAQPAFQKYHGGQAIRNVKQLFGDLLGMDGFFPVTAYFSVDNMDSFYLPTMDSMAVALTGLVRNTANSADAGKLFYNKRRGDTLDESDVSNMVTMVELLQTEDLGLPENTGLAMGIVLSRLDSQVRAFVGADLTVSSVQAGALQMYKAVIGLLVALDFFSDRYPEKEAFKDQSFVHGKNIVEPEAQAPEGTFALPPSTPYVPQPPSDVAAPFYLPVAPPSAQQQDVFAPTSTISPADRLVFRWGGTLAVTLLLLWPMFDRRNL